MIKITADELSTLVKLHGKWLINVADGKCADLVGADLRGAILGDASLMGADLREADLVGADLRGANLRFVDLAYASLMDADLRGADLRVADLRGADLVGADLRGADLRRADLRGADLRFVDLAYASLVDAYLRDTDLRSANFGDVDVPVVPNLDSAILAAIEADPASFDMGSWHRETECGTTHCRAGLTVVLAGEAGAALERKIGTPAAAALIYAASSPNLPVPDFYATTEEALADMAARAGRAVSTP